MKIGRLEIRILKSHDDLLFELENLAMKYETWCLKNKLPESKEQRNKLNKIVYSFRKFGRMESVRE